MRLSLSKLAVAIGGAAVALSAATGVASADPLIDTNCTEGQVMAAVNDPNVVSPDIAAKFNKSPAARSYLAQFLAAPPSQRAQMAQQLQSMPPAYQQAINAVAQACASK